MEVKFQLVALVAFVAGLFAAGLFFNINHGATGFVVLDSVQSNVTPPISDYLGPDSFLLLSDRVIVRVANASVASYSDSGSMMPFITNYSHGIRVSPKNESDIHIGDIVSYHVKQNVIVHRVIRIQDLGNTTYYVTKGDNAATEDAPITFKQIEWKLIGILY